MWQKYLLRIHLKRYFFNSEKLSADSVIYVFVLLLVRFYAFSGFIAQTDPELTSAAHKFSFKIILLWSQSYCKPGLHLGLVVQICNPKYSGDGDRRMDRSRPFCTAVSSVGLCNPVRPCLRIDAVCRQRTLSTSPRGLDVSSIERFQ